MSQIYYNDSMNLESTDKPPKMADEHENKNRLDKHIELRTLIFDISEKFPASVTVLGVEAALLAFDMNAENPSEVVQNWQTILDNEDALRRMAAGANAHHQGNEVKYRVTPGGMRDVIEGALTVARLLIETYSTQAQIVAIRDLVEADESGLYHQYRAQKKQFPRYADAIEQLHAEHILQKPTQADATQFHLPVDVDTYY